MRGEVYRLLIDDRPLEDTVSRRALLRDYARQRRDRRAWTSETWPLALPDGDAVANQVLRTAFTRLGLALAPWLNRFGATALVVGGSMSQSWDLVHPALIAGIHASPHDVPDLRVFPARDSEGSALLGAGWQAVRGDRPNDGEWKRVPAR